MIGDAAFSSLCQVLMFAFGCCLGSFFNVVIHRLPHGESIVSPGSHCPQCQNPISAYDNIPLLSYVLLRGRCRHCGAHISWRYPMVELLTGLMLVLLFRRHGWTVSFQWSLFRVLPSGYLLYRFPILIGVNLFTFGLFFVVNTPEDMARMQLGAKRVTPDAIEKWKAERGYDRPLVWNGAAAGAGRITDTIFFQKSAKLFAFDFGNADDGRSIGHEIRTRMWPSLALAIPSFLVGLAVYITFALMLAFFRATYLDFWGVVLCVAMMSISALFYIIGGQYLISKLWSLVPISGFQPGPDAVKFLCAVPASRHSRARNAVEQPRRGGRRRVEDR